MTAIDVEVKRVTAAERPALENLFQLYVHDFSENWAGTPRGEVDENGLFERYPLDSYWRDEGHVPLFVRHGENLAGFVLLDRASHFGDASEHNVAELFILRKHRRAGVAHAAMSTVLDRTPGQWEAAVARKNTTALAFWRRLLTTHARVRDLEEHDVSSPSWNGPVLRFRVATT